MSQTNRPKKGFYPSVRNAVIDRARDDSGKVICHHCKDPITDQQTITIQHVKPWREVRQEFESNPVVKLLPDSSKNTARRQAFNMLHTEPDDLVPLHVACHREVDFGLEFTPEERSRINRRHYKTNRKAAIREKEESKAVLHATKQSGFTLKKEKIDIAHAPIEELLKLRTEAEAELEEAKEKIMNFHTPSSVVGETRIHAGKRLDKLITYKHGLYERIDKLDNRISALFKSEKTGAGHSV